MRHLRHESRCRVYGLLIAVTISISCSATNAAMMLLGVQYQQDNPYAEFQCLYHYGNYPTNCGNTIVGANVLVFLKNTGASSVTINDVNLAGYSLDSILERNASLHDSASIYYHWNDPPQDIFDAGEPIWYRADPNPIPAGGVARVVVRLRTLPVTQPVSVGVVTSAGTINTTVPVNANEPVLASVGFSSDRTKVYLHWRRNPAGCCGSSGAAPASIYLDGVNVTASATTVSDASVNFAATVLQLASPLSDMSYHVYQGVYADGKTATGALRTWVNRFIYGTWAAGNVADGDFAGAQAWINTCNNRGVNALIMNNGSGGLSDYLGTSAGQSYAESHDYGYVKDENSWGTNPRMWFIDDEPDIEEGNISCGTGFKIPCNSIHYSGILGMKLLERGEVLRAYNPAAPTTINLDGNMKPDGWYNYGQLADVMMVDSYYESEMSGNHWYHPERDPLYTKPTSIYAAAIGTATAAEPNPMHMILYSCETKDQSLNLIWPFPTPQSKRIQAYYALAGGAKGMAYWWYKSGYPNNGLNDGGPEAIALWNEIGLVGDEIKTAQPLLVTSHPVTTTLAPSAGVWAKTLAVGIDSMILIAVNDQFYNDTAGVTHLTPIPDASVTLTLPSWLTSSPTAFEITSYGIADVGATLSGSQLLVSLGSVNVTRMIVITTNPTLKSDIISRYLTNVRPGICAFASSYCAPQNSAPTITMQPFSTTVQGGSLACFAVSAAGTGPFTYQWQKNQSNLSNGTGIAGATSAGLQLTNIDSADAGSYRCVVSNSSGSVNSSSATLTVTPPPCGNMTNASFEGGNTGGVSTGWTSYQRAPNPTTVWSVQTASPPSGTGSQYQQILSTSSTGGAGVRQDVSGMIPGVTYTISGWMRTNSASATCTVKCSPTASTDWSTAQNLTPAQTTTTSTWVSFNGTIVATGISMTIWLDGQTGGTGLNKACCFDAVQVSCNAPAGPTITQQPGAQSVCAGGTATFSVAATGSGTLTYHWQKNQATLSNGGHYSGATSTTLTVTSVDATDVANYRCIVTNTDGNTTSDEVPLTLGAPAVTLQPMNQTVQTGGTASFTITATGNGALTYQWQKTSVNLSNGGHYSGVTMATLTVSSADSNDAANYRCVVTGACGNATSNAASLTVSSCASPSLTNGDFEGGNTGGVATGWTGYQRTPNPNTVWTILTVSPPAGGGLQYQQIANTSATGGGGVRQDVTGCTIGFTYTISGWMRTNSASATCTVKCSPSASTVWSTAIDLNPPQTTTSNAWVPFSGTVTATGTTMTIWLDGQTGGTGLNKASCFDSVTVTGCTAPAPPSITQHPSAQNLCPGTNTTFTVAATGAGTLTYQWQKNNSNLSNGGHYSNVTTTTLTVSSTDAGDVAAYRCVISNGGGSTNSNAANLTLKAATTIGQQPQPQSAITGGSAVFSVTATGEGTTSYQWQKNGSNVTNTGHYSGATTASLTVSSADNNDGANYRCIVTAGCGIATSNQAALTVNAPVIPGDFDHDGDVDQDDFAHLQICFDPLNDPQHDPNCDDANLDADGVGIIDQNDLTVFLQCMTGPNIAGSPNCAN